MRLALALTLALVAATGCTHSMHRAYQTTMGVVAVGADTCSVLQTRAVLRAPGGSGQETDVMLGKNPNDVRLAGALGLNVALVSATALYPLRGEATDDWIRDVLLTTEVVVFGLMAANDNTMTGDPHRCGVRW